MRAIWSGSLTFGLIHIPVKLYSASKERALRFTLLEKHELCPVSYLRVCRGTNKEVPYRDIVRGYEYKKGDYVILSDEDLRRVRPRRTKSIDIVHFSDERDIDRKYYDKPYYVEPGPRAEKAYVLLRAALKRAEKVAIAKFVLKDKEYLAAIQPEGQALVLHQLRYENEIRPPKSLRLPGTANYSEQELQMTLALIQQLEARFKAEQHTDTYTRELEETIRARAKGATLPSASSPTPLPPTQMRDLMNMLKKSLERAPRRRRKTRPTRSRMRQTT